MDLSNHILFEDDFILVVNKPCGLMVEPDRNGYHNLLNEVKAYIKNNLRSDQELYAQHIHRLDRPVSGIVLFAKQKQVLRNLSEQFAHRLVTKSYQAITNNSPEFMKGSIEHWHRKEKKKAALYMEPMPYTELAKLTYTVNPFLENFLWNIDLYTGKFHQIRSQLSSLGCPIIGDELYGSTVSYQANAIALHASFLSFLHPITCQPMKIKNIKNWKL